MYRQYPTISAGEDCQYITQLERGLFAASSYAGSVINPYVTLSEIPAPNIPEGMTDRAADWGGYRVIKDWQGKAPFTREQYVAWLYKFLPGFAATWDYPCGDEAGQTNPLVVQDRQDNTTLMSWYFWHHYKQVPWSWVPTVQGWTIEDYQRHAEDLYPLLKKMHAYYQRRDGEQSTFRVGIGSLVKRKPRTVRQIIEAVAAILPFDFHCWGMNYSMLKSNEPLHPQVVSGDTSSYNKRFGRNLEQDKANPEPQRKIVFQDRLPEYLKKIDRELAAPKQYIGLFDAMEEHKNAPTEDIA